MKSPPNSPRHRCASGLAAAAAICLLFAAPLASRAAAVLRVGGTGAALGTFRVVAEAFRREHPNVAVEIPASLGSGGGLRALADGRLDVALSSRPLEDRERGRGVVLREFGRTPFVFAVADTTPVRSLSLDEVAAIYEGVRETWPDGTRIRIVTRPRSDSNTVTLASLSPRMAGAVEAAFAREGMVLADTDQENAARLETLPGAFGACTLAQIRSEARHLRALAIDGVTPSPEALQSGAYPYGQSMYLAVRDPALPLVEAFVAFVFSHPTLLRDLGFVPGPRE